MSAANVTEATLEAVVRALGDGPAPRDVGGRDAFRADIRDRYWLVLAGHVDIFLVALDDDDDGVSLPRGRRTHLIRVQPGQVVRGIPRESIPPGPDGKRTMIGVPGNGTRLVEADDARLGRARRTDPAALVGVVERTILGSARVRRAQAVVPLDCHRLAAGDTIELQPGARIAAKEGVVWVESAPGTLSDGLVETIGGDLPLNPTSDIDVVAPLTDVAWVHVEQPCRLHAISTQDALQLPSWQRDAQTAQAAAATALISLGDYRRQESEQEIARLRRLRGGAFTRSLEALAKPLLRRRDTRSDPTQTPLARAAEIVCRASGFELNLAEGASRDLEGAADPVMALARATHSLVRRVRLDERWWESDHGPLLVQVGKEEAPRALLPTSSRRRYRLVDPETRQEQRVTEEVAGGISPRAWSFMRPLPPGEMSGTQLVGFGLRGGGRSAWTILGMILLTGLLSLVQPIVTGWVMDPVIPEARFDQLIVLCSALAVIGLSVVAFNFVQQIAMLRIEGMMGNTVQVAVWDRVLRLPLPFFKDFTVGDLVNRADGIDHLRKLFSSGITRSLTHATTGLFSLALVLYYDWKIALAAALVAGLYMLPVGWIGWRLVGLARRSLNLNGALQGVVLQILSGVTHLRVLGGERAAVSEWANRDASLIEIFYKKRIYDAVLSVVRSGVQALALFAAIFVIAWQVDGIFAFFETPQDWADLVGDKIHTVMPTARFVALNVAVGNFVGAVLSFTEVCTNLVSAGPLYERVRPIVTAREEATGGVFPAHDLHGSVEFNNVRFRYVEDGPLVLDGLDMRVGAGEFVALTGPSGVGKSTVFRLLLGFESPEEGSIYIDGIDIQQIDRQRLRRSLGVVLQDTRLLTGSILSNIVAGTDASEDDAWEAARMAGIADDIAALPMGMDTYLGEGAGALAAGQRQRIVVARALVRKPRVIVFDEATSALDNTVQESISDHVARLNATRIVIAHRLSTIRQADRIFVLKEGRVVESGRYEELVARAGEFAELVRRQQA